MHTHGCVGGRVKKSSGIPWRREWQPTLVFLPGEFHGQRSLMGYSPRGGKKSEGLTLCFTKEDTESQGGGNDRSKVNC